MSTDPSACIPPVPDPEISSDPTVPGGSGCFFGDAPEPLTCGSAPGPIFYNAPQTVTLECAEDSFSPDVSVTIPYGAYSSDVSQEDADDAALAAAQALAEAALECQWANDDQTFTAECDEFSITPPVEVTIFQGTFISDTSKSDANTQAATEAQSEAEAALHCQWANTEQEFTITCEPPAFGDPVTAIVEAGEIISDISQEDADALALAQAEEEANETPHCGGTITITSHFRSGEAPGLIGFDEYTDISSPPRRYLVETQEGTAGVCRIPDEDCDPEPACPGSSSAHDNVPVFGDICGFHASIAIGTVDNGDGTSTVTVSGSASADSEGCQPVQWRLTASFYGGSLGHGPYIYTIGTGARIDAAVEISFITWQERAACCATAGLPSNVVKLDTWDVVSTYDNNGDLTEENHSERVTSSCITACTPDSTLSTSGITGDPGSFYGGGATIITETATSRLWDVNGCFFSGDSGKYDLYGAVVPNGDGSDVHFLLTDEYTEADAIAKFQEDNSNSDWAPGFGVTSFYEQRTTEVTFAYQEAAVRVEGEGLEPGIDYEITMVFYRRTYGVGSFVLYQTLVLGETTDVGGGFLVDQSVPNDTGYETIVNSVDIALA